MLKTMKINFAIALVVSAGLCGTVSAVSFKVPAAVDAQIAARRAGWIAKAEALLPRLHHETVRPVGTVAAVKDAAAFQGVRGETRGNDWTGGSFILDFGRHLTGFLSFRIASGPMQLDHPLRLRFVFGETLAEVTSDPDARPTGLSRAWFQDEVVNVDFCPGETRLPRRYAFRYVRCDVVEHERCSEKFRFEDFAADAVTSADSAALRPFAAADDLERRVDAVAVSTLRDCMQEFFEDGPKRDRRLWLGDLRLQALANYETYRNTALVKRCLYLHAGLSEPADHIVRTDLYGRPAPHRGDCLILDYTALFAATLLEYLDASDDRETAEDLWPIALKQLETTLRDVDEEGLFHTSSLWCFIDWDADLDRQAAEQGALLYGLRRTIALADRLGRHADVVPVEPLVEKMRTAAKRAFWDAERRLFVSGPARQVSMASQIWLTLAGAVEGPEAKDALLNAVAVPDVRRPLTPYLNTYWVWALDSAGLRAEARRHLMGYWGGMVKKGADTFWEGYDPTNDFFSPYGNHLINSMCHAWSCAPCYFLRRWAKERKMP